MTGTYSTGPTGVSPKKVQQIPHYMVFYSLSREPDVPYNLNAVSAAEVSAHYLSPRLQLPGQATTHPSIPIVFPAFKTITKTSEETRHPSLWANTVTANPVFWHEPGLLTSRIQKSPASNHVRLQTFNRVLACLHPLPAIYRSKPVQQVSPKHLHKEIWPHLLLNIHEYDLWLW